MTKRVFYRIAVGVTVTLLGSLVGAVVLAEGALHLPPAFRIEPSPANADRLARETGATWKPAHIEASDGTPLRGWLFEPAAPNGHSAILLHGVADTRLGMLGHARYLLDAGYSVLTPDSRGHGSSGGDPLTYGLRERHDIRQWAAWLLDRRPGRLYGLGASMGAAILLQSLATDVPFRAVVTEDAFSDFRNAAYDRVSGILRIRPVRYVLAPFVEPALLYAWYKYGVSLADASPVEALRSTRVPVLLIHGTADENIPIEHSRRLAREAPTAEFWEVPGAAHVQTLRVAPVELPRRVKAWFDSHR